MIDSIIIIGAFAVVGLLVKHFYVGPPVRNRIQEIIMTFKAEFTPIKDYLDGLADKWRAWADQETKELRAELDAAKTELSDVQAKLAAATSALEAHAQDVQDTLNVLASAAKGAGPATPGATG